MEIRELLQKRAALWYKAKKFLDDHTDKDGKISATNAAIADRMISEIDASSENIDRYNKLESWDKELSKPFNTPHFEPFGNPQGDGYRQKFLSAVRANFRNSAGDLREASLPDGGYLLPVECTTK